MKKTILIGIILLMFVPLVGASDVTRTIFNDSVEYEENVEVKLDVVVDGGETFYAIDEILPL